MYPTIRIDTLRHSSLGNVVLPTSLESVLVRDDGSDFEGDLLQATHEGQWVGFVGRQLLDNAAEILRGKDSLGGNFKYHVVDLQACFECRTVRIDP